MKFQSIKVLLIDANANEAAELRRKLAHSRSTFFSVQTVQTLSGALALLGRERFDAALLDLGVPDSCGIASLKELQSRSSEIPIVIVSSVYQDLQALETVRAGAQDYLIKGRLNSAALERILLYCIERQRARKRTAMQSSLSRVLAESETRPEVRTRVMQVLCEYLDYDFGQAWLLDQWSTELIPVQVWNATSRTYADLQAVNHAARFAKGVDLPGRAWTTGKPIWIADVAQDPDFARAQVAVREGLRSVLAFPITLGPETLGVIELFSAEICEPDEDLLKVVASIGNQVGQFAARKRAEEDRERLTQEKLLILESASEGIYGIDLNGCITFINQSAAKMFRCNAAEVSGQRAHALFHHSHPNGSAYTIEECPIFQALQDGKSCQNDKDYFWRTDGTPLSVDYSSFPVIAGEEITGAVVCFNDITDRKRMEMELRQAQRLEAVGGLAAGIAHEINTPIQFVGDNTRFLQEAFGGLQQLLSKYQEAYEEAKIGTVSRKLQEEVMAAREKADWEYLHQEIPKALEQTLDGVGRVAKIVRAMKEFSHVDRSPEKSAGDLNKALESTLIVARSELKYVADVETDYGELPLVLCHLGDLNQVFLNLFINAAHAIGDVMKVSGKKGRIGVRTRRDGQWVEVAISDTGTGIPEAARDKIFNPFFTTKQVGKGTGQGLTLARAIVVEKHGGTLTFGTEMGKGTTFYVRLPVNGTREPREAVAK